MKLNQSKEHEAFIADIGVIDENSKLFQAPEILKSKDYIENLENNLFNYSESDTYSLGLILLFCLDRKGFRNLMMKRMRSPTSCNFLNLFFAGFKGIIPDSLKFMLSRMLALTPRKRYKIEEIEKEIECFKSKIKSSRVVER